MDQENKEAEQFGLVSVSGTTLPIIEQAKVGLHSRFAIYEIRFMTVIVILLQQKVT